MEYFVETVGGKIYKSGQIMYRERQGNNIYKVQWHWATVYS